MSRLEEISAGFRKTEIAKNTYNNNDPYNSGNPNALSDGDDKGKGEMNGDAGSATDIKLRKQQLAKNRFSKNKEYNAGTA